MSEQQIDINVLKNLPTIGDSTIYISSIMDIDLTTPPIEGQALIYNSTNNMQEPRTVSSGESDILYGGTF